MLQRQAVHSLYAGQMKGGFYNFYNHVQQGMHYYYWLEVVMIDGNLAIEPVIQNTYYWGLFPIIQR
jgi:hypothetical protein